MCNAAGYAPGHVGPHRSSDATADLLLSTLLIKLHQCVAHPASCYKLCMRRRTSGLRPPAPPFESTLSLVCVTAAVAMEQLRGARCLVFASGTLGPAREMAAEMSLASYEAVSTRHHANIDELFCPIVLTHDSRGKELRITSSAFSKDLAKVGRGGHPMDAVADTLLACLPSIPGGALCFFTSKAALANTVARWRYTKDLQKLEHLLPCGTLFIDLSESADDSAATVDAFRNATAVAGAGRRAARCC
jgi:Rad3-related DNA helicase